MGEKHEYEVKILNSHARYSHFLKGMLPNLPEPQDQDNLR